MPDQVFRNEMQQVLDEVYRDRERAAVREVYASASTHLHLSAEMLASLNRIPEGGYTKQEMTEAINEIIRSRGEPDTLDPPQVPAPPRIVEDTVDADRAVADDPPSDP